MAHARLDGADVNADSGAQTGRTCLQEKMQGAVGISAAFVWDNFGPVHVDRCEAVACDGSVASVHGIELFGKSDTYQWSNEQVTGFEKVTLFQDANWESVSILRLALRIVRQCRTSKAKYIFLCHYERAGILIAAIVLRLCGHRVYAMGCSKFDDYKRSVWREVVKSAFYLPYRGALSSGRRAKDYMRFLGFRTSVIKSEYNTVSISRIRRLSGVESGPNGTEFCDRHFTIVARFVPKKNISMAIQAYELYAKAEKVPRRLHICGSGPLEAELLEQTRNLNLEDKVIFRGFLQTADIAAILGKTVALILPSIEEQFGNVVIEAQAMGVPIILSDNCGARDELVRTAVNGFVVEPDNPSGLAFFMSEITRDRETWRRMSEAALVSSVKGDTANFVKGVKELAAV